jgi:hypothetical protein
MPCTLMPMIEVSRVANIKVTHEFAKVPQGSLHQKMEMIAHQNIAVEFYSIDIQRMGQFLKKLSPVAIVPKYCLLFVAPAGHMVHGIWILHPKRSRHTKPYSSFLPILSIMKI